TGLGRSLSLQRADLERALIGHRRHEVQDLPDRWREPRHPQVVDPYPIGHVIPFVRPALRPPNLTNRQIMADVAGAVRVHTSDWETTAAWSELVDLLATLDQRFLSGASAVS